MEMFWSESGMHREARFESEAHLEATVIRLQLELFGPNRIYLDIKRKIGAKGGQRNIPDGYLLDLSGPKPKLFVVENELCSHDPLRHIAVQILQFSLAFESEPRLVRNILLQALQTEPSAFRRVEAYALSHDYRNLDHMLEWLVSDSEFAALIIIDQIPEALQDVLNRKFRFGVELLELSPYLDPAGKFAFRFVPFLADLTPTLEDASGGVEEAAERPLDYELDTIVVPAREDGFQETFLGQDRWYSVRIHASMREQIKFIAIYRVAPVSAITHLAAVRSIEPWEESGKWVIYCSEHAQAIGPVSLVKGGKVKSLQNLRYANRSLLLKAKSMDDLW